MYKIKVDPISKEILSITHVAFNTPIYHTDILLEDDELAKYMKSFESNGLLVSDDFASKYLETNFQNAKEYKKFYEELQDQKQRFNEIHISDEHKYLAELILQGSSIEEARTEIKAAREESNRLEKLIEEHEELHKQHVKGYWLEQNRLLDSTLNCKYYSAICLLIKDENRYLREWIDWHIALNFHHIFIFDNGSHDDVNDVVLQCDKSVQDKITVINWRGHHNHIQQDAYNYFMDKYKEDVRWVLCIDSDEFVKFTDKKTTDVNEFLKQYEDYTEIWGYEIEYNADGKEKYEDLPVKQRFTNLVESTSGVYWKNFVQPNRISSWTMHYANYDPEKNLMFIDDERNKDLFVIEHYYTKSWEEWCWKIKERGGADPNYHKLLAQFFDYNPDMSYLKPDDADKVMQAYE